MLYFEAQHRDITLQLKKKNNIFFSVTSFLERNTLIRIILLLFFQYSSHIDESLKIVFMIGNSICHLEFEI